jgi:GTPase
MKFVDEVHIEATAGAGGNGVVRWRQDKFEPKGGPAGGDGGYGGNIVARAVRGMKNLAVYRSKRVHEALKGEDGMGGNKHGAAGEDTVLDFPVGTIIHFASTGKIVKLTKDSETKILLRGGAGGKGNTQFKSSKNVTPEKATDGRRGESEKFFVELELLADVGLVGMPNAGKSSLLNMLTRADAKIGDYAFTTLDPNLGDFYGYTIADIPGLIEGASEGKGLGTKFLRHIKGTHLIVHLVSLENPDPKKTYEAIRAELAQYGKGLDEKEEVIVLTKTDTIEDEKVIAKYIKDFQKFGKPVFAISLFDDTSVKKLRDGLVEILREEGK